MKCTIDLWSAMMTRAKVIGKSGESLRLRLGGGHRGAETLFIAVCSVGDTSDTDSQEPISAA